MPRLLDPFTISDLVATGLSRNEIYDRAISGALRMKDKPNLPHRDFDDKLSDKMAGEGPEIWFERHGFKRSNSIYEDVEGGGWDLAFLNSRLELKTIREPSLEKARNAIRYSYNKRYDHLIVWTCIRRGDFLWSPFCVFKRGCDEPILMF